MFRDIEADFYVMVDGDDTYEAAVAPKMLELAQFGSFDLVNGVRVETGVDAYRNGHRWGNVVLTGMVRRIFGKRMQDMLSGYKVFSRRFVKSFPALSHGFDIETELTIHALELSMPVAHTVGHYSGRAEGSVSKLLTYRDGWRILMMILKLVRHERPLFFFAVLSMVLAAASIFIAAPVVLTYLELGQVPRLPTAVLSTGIALLAALSLLAGIILDTVSRGRREARFLAYLCYPAFMATSERSTQPPRA